MPRKSAKPTEESKLSAKERLARMAGKAKPAPAGSAKKPRVQMELDQAEMELCDRLCAYTEIAKEAEGLKKTTDAVLRPMLIKKIFHSWVSEGRKTENPTIHGARSNALLQAKDNTSRFKIPPKADGSGQSFVEYLRSNNIPDTLIGLLAKEVKEKEIQVIASPDKVEEKNPALAEKIREAIMAALEDAAPEEIAQIITTENEITVTPGLVERIPGYCKAAGKTQEEAVALLGKLIDTGKIIQFAISGIHCHNLEQELRTVSRKIVGVDENGAPIKEEPQEFSTEDKVYKFVILGTKVAVFKGEGELGVKKCTDTDHALNTVKKWQRDRNSLEAAIKEWTGG